MERVDSYKCSECGKIYRTESEAIGCEFVHKQVQYANYLLSEGHTLHSIQTRCGFQWQLKTIGLGAATNQSCFIIERLQKYDTPEYKIRAILTDSKVQVQGIKDKSFRSPVSITDLMKLTVYDESHLFLFDEK